MLQIIQVKNSSQIGGEKKSEYLSFSLPCFYPYGLKTFYLLFFILFCFDGSELQISSSDLLFI